MQISILILYIIVDIIELEEKSEEEEENEDDKEEEDEEEEEEDKEDKVLEKDYSKTIKARKIQSLINEGGVNIDKIGKFIFH